MKIQAADECSIGTRRGFTIIELLFVLLIAAVLGGLALPQFSRYMNMRSIVNATDGFRMMAARARATAVERGDVVVLSIDPSRDLVVLVSTDGTDTIDVLDLARSEPPVDLGATSGLALCYVARGFVHPGCGSGGDLPQDITFSGPSGSMTLEINAIGQVKSK